MKTWPAFALVILGSISFHSSAHAANYSCQKAPCFSAGGNGWLIGEIRSFAFPAASQSLMAQEMMAQGWVECAGQTLSRAAFPKLFNAIGDSWGSGDGRTDFYLPDLRGQTLRGWDDKGSQKQAPAFGGDPDALTRAAPRPEIAAPGTAGNTGDSVGSIQPGLVGQHSHTNPNYSYWQLHNAERGNGIGMFMNYSGGMPSGPVDGGPAENRVNNVYVMYAIYVGAPVAVDNQTKQLTRRK
jgi:hypothetical protein